MSTVTVTVDWSRPVWKCAADDDSRLMLRAAHIEREDASHVRVTCSDGFSLASVVYPAEVPDDFTFADVPAELLQYMADAAQTSDSPGCENCGEGERVSRTNWLLALDTEQKVAEVKTGLMSCRMSFIEPVGKGFPDWRELLRKVLKEWKPEKPTPSIAIDPELLTKASKAIGTDFIARMCIPTSPRDGVVILGSDGCFAIVMPMFTPDDAPDRVKALTELVREPVLEVLANA